MVFGKLPSIQGSKAQKRAVFFAKPFFLKADAGFKAFISEVTVNCIETMSFSDREFSIKIRL